jgi:hypothetical protein
MSAQHTTAQGRLIRSLVAAVAVVFALAGCSLIPLSGALGALSGSSAPKSGQCWETSNANAVNWVDWQGSAATDCSANHDLYTYEVGKISGVTANSWSNSQNPSQPTAEVQAKSIKACNPKVLIPRLKWNEELVQGFFFIPSKAQWASGARWVRCDVGVLAHGTTLVQEELIKLPPRISTLVSEVSSDPLRFDYCINSPVPANGAGPLANNDFNRVADCRDNPEWMLAGRGTLTEKPGSPFPTGAQANSDSQKICARFETGANKTWIAYLPPETSTATVGTDREVTCWVGRLDSDDSSGGVA